MAHGVCRTPTLLLTIPEILKWLPILMQKSFRWQQSSARSPCPPPAPHTHLPYTSWDLVFHQYLSENISALDKSDHNSRQNSHTSQTRSVSRLKTNKQTNKQKTQTNKTHTKQQQQKTNRQQKRTTKRNPSRKKRSKNKIKKQAKNKQKNKQALTLEPR